MLKEPERTGTAAAFVGQAALATSGDVRLGGSFEGYVTDAEPLKGSRRERATITVPMSKAMKTVTIDVRFTQRRRHAVRMWLAAGLFRFAARVAGCNVEISIKDEDRSPSTAEGAETTQPQAAPTPKG